MSVLEFQIDGGGSVLVQAPSGGIPAGVVTRGLNPGPAIERAQQSFTRALDTIQAVSDSVLDQIKALSRQPDEMQVEFGLEFSAQAGSALLAAATGTAQLRVTITWKADPAPAAG